MARKKRFSFGFSYNSPVILSFAMLCLIVLFIGEATDGTSTRLLFSVYRFKLTDVLGYPRMILHVLGHTDYEHMFSNVCLLLVIGPMAEEKYGSKNMLIAICATALITGTVHIIVSPTTALLGASGIVFMLMLMASVTGSEKGYIPLTLVAVAVIYIGSEIYNGIVVADDISQLTHIIGGICGIIWSFVLPKKSL